MSVNGVINRLQTFRNEVKNTSDNWKNDKNKQWMYEKMEDPFNMIKTINFMDQFLEDNKYNMNIDGCIINRNYEGRLGTIFDVMKEHDVKYIYVSIRSGNAFMKSVPFYINNNLIKEVGRNINSYKYFPFPGIIKECKHYMKYEIL